MRGTFFRAARGPREQGGGSSGPGDNFNFVSRGRVALRAGLRCFYPRRAAALLLAPREASAAFFPRGAAAIFCRSGEGANSLPCSAARNLLFFARRRIPCFAQHEAAAAL